MKSVFKLFDALIVPVFSYGCQVWLYCTYLFKLITNGQINKDPKNSLKKIAKDPTERIHLKLLKWTLGVNKKASNIGCWGDSGRMPMVLQLVKQTFDFQKRLEALDQNDSSCLVRHAYVDQRDLGLPWFAALQSYLHNGSLTANSPSVAVREATKHIFEELWLSSVTNSSKLKFYSMVKFDVGYEPYLSLADPNKRKVIAKLRTSNHRLNNETGRYINTKSPSSADTILWKKCCKICSSNDAEYLASLPFFEPILEDEQHVLVSCPLYHHVRLSLPDEIKSTVISWEPGKLVTLFSDLFVKSFATYMVKLFHLRFPRKGTKPSTSPESTQRHSIS